MEESLNPREPFPSEEDLADLEILKDNLEDYFRDTIEDDDLPLRDEYDPTELAKLNEDKEF